MIVPVSAADDPRLAPYQALKDNAVARGRDGFIVEGAVALRRILETRRFPLESLFLSERSAAQHNELLLRVESSIPVYVAPQTVMDGVAGYHLHRGVLALARRRPDPGAAALIAEHGDGPLIVLVLVGLSNHDNVGACFRNAAALGADLVLLDQTSCDPLYRKAIRVSSGACLSLPYAHGGTGEDLIALLKRSGVECWAMSPGAAEPLAQLASPPRLAIVLGPEGPGLAEGLMQQCRRVSIPMSGGMDSLNVATAGAIALAHAMAARAG